MLSQDILKPGGNSNVSLEKTVSQIKFEIGQIDRLFVEYAELLERTQTVQPSLIELTALASVIHSFYNGIENIFLSISKEFDEEELTGTHWHQDLLTQMTKTTQTRGTVISVKTQQTLKNYLGFRHFFRHSYSYFLEWSQLEKLVQPLVEVWNEVKAELHTFLESIQN